MPEPAPILSVVLSFRNEAEGIPELLKRLRDTLGPAGISYELIFVNDASTDGSLDLLRQAARTDPRVKVITMSRRFGVSECIMAGMERARGEAVVYLDTDLQDPPEVIPRMIEAWRGGADVVYTVREVRLGENHVRAWLTRSLYRLIRLLSREVDLPVEAGDFRLLSRRAAAEVLRLKEKDPYFRGLVSWIGFRQVPVPYQRAPRASGRSHFPLFRRVMGDLLTLRGPIGTLLSGITSFSIFPLLFFLLAGGLLGVLSVLALLAKGLGALLGSPRPGLPWWAVALGLCTGLQLLGIGTVGLYLARVYHEARDRPRYIVADTVGFGPAAGDREPERPA